MAETSELKGRPLSGAGVTKVPDRPTLPRYRHRFHPWDSLRELWAARALVRRLAGRQLRSRYRRALLGFGWAIVTPVALTLTFTLILSRAVKVPTAGVPYPMFFYVGLLAWSFFASAVGAGAGSLLDNLGLLKRAYLPREVFPLASIVVAVIDFATAAVVLLVMLPLFHFTPRLTTIWVPVYFVIQACFTTGIVLFVSVAIIYLRDLRHLITLVLQVGLFATPVVYGMAQVPQAYRLAMVTLNPMAEVIDGYRRSILYGQGPDWQYLAISMSTSLLVLAAGYWSFKRMEVGVADIS